MSKTDKRKQNNKDNRLLKLFNRHKDKYYHKFSNIPLEHAWSEIPDVCGLMLIQKLVTGTAKTMLESVDENGVYLRLEQQDLDKFLDKEDDTVQSVVKSLLMCGISVRNGKLFIQIT